MHLKIINPNTTVAMTEGIAKAARAVAAQGAEIESCNPSDGPPSIEGWYDDAIAAAAVMETIRADDGRADAIIIACFGDPGLQAAKEATTRPVVGIAQAAMTMAALIADGFFHRYHACPHHTHQQPFGPRLRHGTLLPRRYRRRYSGADVGRRTAKMLSTD